MQERDTWPWCKELREGKRLGDGRGGWRGR